MFKVYDSNFKEVKIPVDRLGFGSRALEINVGPVIYENVYSQSRRADTLVKRYAKDRQVSIVLMVSGMDEADFRMKRDELYSFFRNLGVFFVAEEQQPFKLIKVIVNDDYDIDRQTPEIAMPEIPLKIIETPFKRSLHTTLELNSEGIVDNKKWAAEMGLDADVNKNRYDLLDFYNAGTEEVKLIRQKESLVEITINEAPSKKNLFNKATRGIDGYISSDDGLVKNNTTFDYSDWINVESRETYILNIAGQWAEYDQNKQFIRGHNTNSAVTLHSNTSFVRISVRKGDVDRVQFENTKSWIEVYDGNTTFRLNTVINAGDKLRMNGDTITLNNVNIISDSNFNFLTVKRGWNNWEVRNVSDFDFRIDFRFLYD